MNKLILILFVLLTTYQTNAETGVYLGTNFGFLGTTALTDINVKYSDNDTKLPGADTADSYFYNELSLKFQIGYSAQLTDEAKLILALGYLKQNTVKNLGKRIEFGAVDAALGFMLHAGSNLKAKLGVNLPLINSFYYHFDDSSKGQTQGGELRSRGYPGIDLQVAYAFTEYANVYIGFNYNSVIVAHNKIDSNEKNYTIDMKYDATHIVIGFDYTVSAHRDTHW